MENPAERQSDTERLTRGERVALTQANEDWHQLVEIVWRLRNLDPSASTKELLDEAKVAVGSLLRKDLVDLVYADRRFGSERTLERIEALRLVQEPSTWEPTEDQEFLSFVPTDKGRAWWRSGDTGPPSEPAGERST